jgi:ABC-type dipeptide/oligopeptide/nickel transport system ATPase subunit
MVKRFATRWQATEQVLALAARTRRSLAKINETCVNANGVFQHPETQLSALKAARDHIDEAIEIIQALTRMSRTSSSACWKVSKHDR